MFRYRLHSPEGDDLGEAVYAQMIYPGEEIIGGDAQRFRVLDVVPLDEEDESPFVGLLRVEGLLNGAPRDRVVLAARSLPGARTSAGAACQVYANPTSAGFSPRGST